MAKIVVLYLKRDKKSQSIEVGEIEKNFLADAEKFLSENGGFGKIFEGKLSNRDKNKEKEELKKLHQDAFEEWEHQKAAKANNEEKKDDAPKSEQDIPNTEEVKSENTAEEYYKNEKGRYVIFYKYNDINCEKPVDTLDNAKVEERKGFIYIQRKSDTPEIIKTKRNELKAYKNEKDCLSALGFSTATQRKPESKVEHKSEGIPRQNTYHGFNESKSDRSLDNFKNELIIMKQEIRKLNDKIYDCAKKADIANALDSKLSSLSRNLKEYFESVIVKGLSTTPDKEFIAKKFDNMTEGVAETLDGFALDIQNTKSAAEAIQGKVTAVEGILSQKGVTISKETAPINDDAKAIANAKRLVDRLIADIAAAAVEYGNNKDVLDNLAEKEAQHNQEMIERTEQAKIDARQEVLIELLDKYENIDVLLESENDRTISAFLKNNGLTVDEELKKGTEIEITTEKCEQYLTKAKGVEDAGKYRVIRSAYHFGKKYFPAEIEKITE